MAVSAVPELHVDEDLLPSVQALAGKLERLPTIPAEIDPQLRSAFNDVLQLQQGAIASRWITELAEPLSYPIRHLAQVFSPELSAQARRDQARLGLLGAAQAVYDFQEGTARWAPTGIRELLEWIPQHLELTTEELAAWLTVSPKTIYRWRTGDSGPRPEEEARLRSLARLVAQLRFSYTPVGVAQWMKRPMASLEDRAPYQVLGDEDLVKDLEALARQIRGI